MFNHPRKNHHFAIILTLSLLLCSTSCASLFRGKPNQCKSRAYVENHVGEYIKTRFEKGAPVRLGIIPFAAPANISTRSIEFPGINNTLAWKVRNEILAAGEIPIVEVLNRQDWPGKKEEFPTGNFEGLRQARVADYDLLLVGNVEPLTSLNRLILSYKIMEVETSTTVFSGQTVVDNSSADQERAYSRFYLAGRTPSTTNIPIEEMQDELALCVADALFPQEILPGSYHN